MGVLYFKDPVSGGWVPLSTQGPAGPAGPAGQSGPPGPTGPTGPEGAGMPIGMIAAYGGSTAPAGWRLCDGSAHGSPALLAVTGSPLTPDLRSRFIVGAGPGMPLGTTGGANEVTLTAGQTPLPVHAHGASSGGASVDHQHLVDPPNTGTSGHTADHAHPVNAQTTGGGAHAHQVHLLEGSGTSGQEGQGVDSSNSAGWNASPPNGETVAGQGGHEHRIDVWSGGVNTDHAHVVDIPAFWSGGINQTHAHGVTVNNSAPVAGAAHENRPPFWALTYIIRTGTP